jgi:hypothetical protein
MAGAPVWQVYTPEVGFDRGDELYYMVYTGTNETSAPSKFEFQFLSADAIPVASKTVGTVSEDSKRGVRIALNGSDSDSKYVAFVITQLPRVGKLYMVTGEPIQRSFSAFEVRAFAPRGDSSVVSAKQHVFRCRARWIYRQCTPQR